MSPEQRTRFNTIAVCTALLLLFAFASFIAVNRICATSDEPLHTVAAHVVTYRHDFRVNPEDPPLWQYWCAVPQGAHSIQGDFRSELWPQLLQNMFNHFEWSRDALYAAPDADAILRRSRVMMLVASVALGALLGVAAWQLAGPYGAITASILFCLDPNLMGHASLVKNDIASTLAMFAFAIAIWRLGQAITPLRIIAVALTLSAGLTIKFSGVLLPAMLVLLMIARVILPMPWPVLARTLRSAGGRAIAALCIFIISLTIAATSIWAVYAFRFGPSPAPSQQFNTDYFRIALALNQYLLQHPGKTPANNDIIAQAAHPGIIGSAVVFANNHHLLPQTWLLGFLYTYAGSLIRRGYLLGEIRATGWWYYFPLAFLCKSPLSTIAATIFGISALVRRASQARRLSKKDSVDFQTRQWTFIAFLIPFIIYLISALCSHLNIGLRHIFPLYPFLFLAAATEIAQIAKHRAALTRHIIFTLALLLSIETAIGYPDLIAYFNLPARLYGPIKLLGDSNLDWGQNLPELAKWQEDHPHTLLYLNYFGSVSPLNYSIEYRPVPSQFSEPGVLAISATSLQGIYYSPTERERYMQLLQQRPLAILGGSIYLYTVP